MEIIRKFIAGYKVKLLISILFLFSNQMFAQESLTPQMMEKYAYRFLIDEGNNLSVDAREKWLSLIGENQFIGLAEVHNSIQKSIFTTAILSVLKEKGFDNLALEIGPNSADILNEYSYSTDLGSKIEALNRSYGRKSKPPIIFVNKQYDEIFMYKAFELEYNIWGLDQEFIYSTEMLLDRLFESHIHPNAQQKSLFLEAKKIIRKNRFRKKIKGQHLSCWYQSNKIINDCLDALMGDTKADKIISDIRESWNIYCKSATGIGSNQQRANYMKKNFETYYSQEEAKPKVFLKLGGVHLTRGISQFKVDDMGNYLKEKAEKNKTGFLSIRHMVAFRNGESLIENSEWRSVSMFLELGKKDEWTVVDLRPLRDKLINGLIKTHDTYVFELLSYDLLLLPPDDSFDKANY